MKMCVIFLNSQAYLHDQLDVTGKKKPQHQDGNQYGFPE